MKRTLIYVAAGIVLLGIGVGVYLLFQGKSPTLTTGSASLPSSESSGASGDTSQTVTQALGVAVSGAGTEIAPRLIRITDRPVVVGSKAVFIPGVRVPQTASTTGTVAFSSDPEVRISYLERESGNVYTFTAHARTLTRISNKTLPGIQKALWTPDASLAFVQFLERAGDTENINTYALPSSGEGGYVLERNISSLLLTGSSTLVTLLSTTESSIASASSISGTNVRTLFTSPLSSIRLSSGGGTLIATTKASSKTKGYAFLVSAKDGSFTRMLGPLSGLTTLVSPSGRLVLYSYLDKGKVALAVFDTVSRTATRLPLSTLPEKCVWTSDSVSVYCGVPTNLGGNLPDDWYQGVLSTTDRIWRIDLADRVATQIIDLQTVGAGSIDAISLEIDTVSDVLVFTNRVDGTLWMYDL